MVKGPLMASLKAFLGLSQHLVIYDWRTHSWTGEKLVFSIIEKQQTLHDNAFSEGALQGEIESALRAFCSSSTVQFSVHAEIVLEDENKDPRRGKKNEEIRFSSNTEKCVLYLNSNAFAQLVRRWEIRVHWFPSDYSKFNRKMAQKIRRAWE